MIEIIKEPWPWYIAGPIITTVMVALFLFGKTFGLSSNLRTICSAFGAGKVSNYFDFDWRDHIWNLVFALGLILGGFISHYFLSSSHEVDIAYETVLELQEMGLETAGSHLIPTEIFNWSSLLTLRGFLMMVVGGFLIGFGTRYAGGCTSGHAITGLSSLQIPSLIAVIGFFIGGLFVTNFILPVLLNL